MREFERMGRGSGMAGTLVLMRTDVDKSSTGGIFARRMWAFTIECPAMMCSLGANGITAD